MSQEMEGNGGYVVHQSSHIFTSNICQEPPQLLPVEVQNQKQKLKNKERGNVEMSSGNVQHEMSVSLRFSENIGAWDETTFPY